MRWAEIWAEMFEKGGHLQKWRKGKQKNKKFSEWDPLVGKLLVDLVGVFWRYLEAPSSHICQNICLTDFFYQMY